MQKLGSEKKLTDQKIDLLKLMVLEENFTNTKPCQKDGDAWRS